MATPKKLYICILLFAALTAFIVLLLMLFEFKINSVPLKMVGVSMEPTIKNGEWLVQIP